MLLKSTLFLFADNVIGTSPMIRPAGELPGGRDRYSGNAKSYLVIGEPMGKALVKLKQK